MSTADRRLRPAPADRRRSTWTARVGTAPSRRAMLLLSAVAAGARVERAFEILGDDVPAHLLEAGTLRLQFKQASLEELGKHTNPPLTKDAVAGRIRRLLALADKVAHERGIPDTESALTLEMLEED